MHRRGIYGFIGSAFIILILAGCSTAKNTAGSRFYQSMVTRYNVYHNGAEAYKEGYEAQEKAVNDNYLEILDLYPVSDEKVWSVGTTNYDIAIEKAQKGIKLHSITVKPERKPGKTLTEKDKAWQNKNEYNPFLCFNEPLISYFPAYEIMIDELRDYRFYADDLVHPSTMAIEYIWQRFGEAFLKSSTREEMLPLYQLWRDRHHTFLYPESDEAIAFQQRIQKRIEDLQTKYPWIR